MSGMAISTHDTDCFIAASILRGRKGSLVGELDMYLGIDVQLPRGAPGFEFLSIEIHPDDPEAAALPILYLGLSLFAPGLITGSEDVLIRHNLAARSIILSRIPTNAGDLDRIGHELSPSSVALDRSTGDGESDRAVKVTSDSPQIRGGGAK